MRQLLISIPDGTETVRDEHMQVVAETILLESVTKCVYDYYLLIELLQKKFNLEREKAEEIASIGFQAIYDRCMEQYKKKGIGIIG